MFAYDIDVRTGDSHSIIDARRRSRINPAADVEIGRHVWVASHVSILKGAVISVTRASLGTRAVVTGADSPAGSLAAWCSGGGVRKNGISGGFANVSPS